MMVPCVPSPRAFPTMPRPDAASHAQRYFSTSKPPGRGSCSGEAYEPPDIRRRRAGQPSRAQGGGMGRLRELVSGAIEDQAMMAIARRRKVEELLQQPMHAG